jgi:hypothetical protein
MNKVEKLFIKKKLVIMMPGNMWFVMTKENSIEFIDCCEKEKIQINGIDGFYLHANGKTEPSMANSIDFTSSSLQSDNMNVYEYSRKFIQSKKEDLFFEIVCE